MRIAYIMSMFPCWSETFILNELVNHQKSGLNIEVFSLKTCGEEVVHNDALQFLSRTTYPLCLINPWLWILHIVLAVMSPAIYFSILNELLTLRTSSIKIKIKALVVFLFSPHFVFKARNKKVEHLHAHFATYPSLLAYIISRFVNIPYTITAHAHDIYINQDLLPLICRRAASVITISEYNRRFLIDKLGLHIDNKIAVIHCGIDLRWFAFHDDRKLVAPNTKCVNILSIGRLSGIKGFSFLIDSLKLLSDEGVNFICRIIGDGPLRQQLIAKVIKLKLEHVIIFLGAKRSDMIPLYFKESDVFILACAHDKIDGQDGIPLVFMEAMAYGIPVIGINISGIPELIRHEETGLCAEPENPTDLRKKIKYLLDNPDQAEVMRVNARKLIESEFDIDLTCKELRENFAKTSRL